jgi:hypothetical protein
MKLSIACWIRLLVISMLLSIGTSSGAIPATPVPLPASGQQKLPSGTEPGTFLFTYTGRVGFTQEPAFPVLVTLTDYAHQPVVTMIVTSSAPFILSRNLIPGSYRLESNVGPTRQMIYWAALGPQLFIDSDGNVTAGNTLYGRDLVHEKMLTVLAPDPTGTTTITDKRPLLKWRPLEGAIYYQVDWIVEDAPHHIVGHGHGETTKTQFRLTEDTVPNRQYEWSVLAFGSHKERLGYWTSALFYTGNIRDSFLNVSATVPFTTGSSYLGIIPLPADEFPGGLQGIHVHAVGGNTPAMKAGLQPQDVLTSLNEKSLDQVSIAEFVGMVRAIPAGTRIPIEFVRGGTKKSVELTVETMP